MVASANETCAVLHRAAGLLRLPGSKSPPEVVKPRAGAGHDGALRCPESGRVYPLHDGLLDLLGEEFAPTFGQRMLDTRLTSWIYDVLRPHLGPWLGMPTFRQEVADVISRLELQSGDVVLDIACGQGNFTVELAHHVGPEGLVIGLDIAAAMLARAVGHVRTAGLGNVLLIRGDALALPFADTVLGRVNCSGGLHQLPDLPRALAEMARVSRAGGRLTMSGFASPGDSARGPVRRWLDRWSEIDFVALDRLGSELVKAGFEAVATEMSGGAVGYAWAARRPGCHETPS